MKRTLTVLFLFAIATQLDGGGFGNRGGGIQTASPLFTGSGWIDGRFGIGVNPIGSLSAKLVLQDTVFTEAQLLSFYAANTAYAWSFYINGSSALNIQNQSTGGDAFSLSGTYPNFLVKLSPDGGRVLVNGATDVAKAALNVSGQIKSTMLSAALTDGAPTASELNTATGSTPGGVTAGWEAWIKDTNGTSLMYRIVSDGTSWWTYAGTVAP